MPEIIKYRSNKITIILSGSITLKQYIKNIGLPDKPCSVEPNE